MVQIEPNLQLLLKHVAGSGAVLPAEAVAALDHSLPIKRSEAGLKTLVLWGRLLTRNGKDYLVAEGYNGATAKGSEVRLHAKYFFSQDGARWADLPAVDAETAQHAATLRTMLSGDPAFQYDLPEPAGGSQPEQEPGGDEGSRRAVTEVQRLRCMIDAINAATAVQPKGSAVSNAHNCVVPNRLFGGLAYPDKLESYVHRSDALQGAKQPGLAADVRGSWAVQHDSLRALTQLRSLLFPGYVFFFSGRDLAWGSLYVGDGMPSHDLVFML